MTPPTASSDRDAVQRRLLLVVDLRTAVTIVVALLAAFMLFGLFRHAAGMLTRIAIGVVLALALDAVVQGVRRQFHVPRAAAVAIVGLVLGAFLAIVVVVLGPPAIDQARDFARDLPRTVRELYDLPLIGGVLKRADLAASVSRWTAELPGRVSTESVTRLAESLLGGLAATVIVVVTTFAVLLDGERLVALARNALPPRMRPSADRAGQVFYEVVGRYFGGSLTVAVLMGVYVLALALAFDVPLAPLAAVWAMLTDLIPQIGGFLGGVLLGVLALSAGPLTALIVIVLYVAYMNIENHLVYPLIVGGAVDLTPPTTMLAALIGGAAAGVPGALVATPLVGAAKRLYFEFRYPGRAKKPSPSKFREALAKLWRRVTKRG